jgi:hypothetical protein
MSEARLVPFTKERFGRIKERAEALGYTVISQWRPGLKTIRLADIVLRRGVGRRLAAQSSFEIINRRGFRNGDKASERERDKRG